MRHSAKILATVVALSLLSGCTSFQAKEAQRAAVHGFVGMILDEATGGPERRTSRGRWEDNRFNRDYCYPPCEITAYGDGPATQAGVEERLRRRNLREDAHYKAEADEIMQALDDAEQQSGRPPAEAHVWDYEREELERRQLRDEVLENQPEFDEFMEELDRAERQADELTSIM